MVTGCGKPASEVSSPEFGYLCVRGFKWDDGEHTVGDVLEGGYSYEGLGSKCGDPWGEASFWQLLCVDCLRKAGYLW